MIRRSFADVRWRRRWVVPGLVGFVTTAMLVTGPGQRALATLTEALHAGFLAVYIQGGSLAAGCF